MNKNLFLHLFVGLCMVIATDRVSAGWDHDPESGSLFSLPVHPHSGLHQAAVPAAQVYCPDTLTLYRSDFTVRFIDTYNSKGWTTKRIIQVYANGHWVNYSLYTWTYLNENYNSVDVIQDWSNNQWTNSAMDSSTFDSKGQMLVHLHKYWSQGAWRDSLLTFRTYDEHENMLTNWGEEWNGSKWVKLLGSQAYAYTYDASGRKLTELYQILTNGQVDNATLSTYTYDGNGKMLTYLLQISANGKMTNSQIHSYTYDAKGNLATDWLKGWTNEAWMNGSLKTYTYDASGNLLTVMLQYWLNGAWTNTYQTIYTYDSHGNVLTGNNSMWGGTTWKQADYPFDIRFYDGSSFDYSGYRVEVSYSLHNITDVAARTGSDISEYALAQNYPNPFNPSTTISFSIPSTSFVSLKIFNQIGEEVATLLTQELPKGSYTRTWNASAFSSGVYYYRLQAGTFMTTKRLVVLK
ncbi:MAG TPA: T9SS type A sorting domain-containing protein [Bacteroidota bacterium]|nr:T9SS type A sorting domain-containing protein [Bacteroidota bacterium]